MSVSVRRGLFEILDDDQGLGRTYMDFRDPSPSEEELDDWVHTTWYTVELIARTRARQNSSQTDIS